MASSHPTDNNSSNPNEDEIFNPADAAEEILDADGDAAMDSGSENGDEEGDDQMMQDDQEVIQLQNDSVAHFDLHKDSIFCIAQHPTRPEIIATGGSDGDDAGGAGYIFDSTPEPTPVLPRSYQSDPSAGQEGERKGLEPIYKIEGHEDSINALAFSLPRGDFLVSGGLDGRVRVHVTNGVKWKFLKEVREVEEVNWISACPDEEHPNSFALGANDGSVWIYEIDPKDKQDPVKMVNSYFLHTESCTAGAWGPGGKLLATVSEDGSLYVWDVWGEASAQGITQEGGQTVVGLTGQDQRFKVEGGLYSVGIAPSGAFVAVGGAGGAIKVVGLPRLGADASSGSAGAGKGGAGAASKAKGGKQAGGKASGSAASAGQAGQILADLQAQTDGVETIAFAPPPLTLMAAGSVDGSIALFDSAHRFAVRRHIKEAHEEHSVVKVEFVKNAQTGGWLLTSCGMDGVVRRWDTRGGTGMANSGFVREWKGHRGDGEGGGVLGFVQGDGTRIVTAGDDSISLVFESPL
ncbi:putative SQT1 Suppresses dominant-negative mutants of the ribosomal QSR1 protein [Rutstroemia sp. NJR-2017a WRK4]|nr:putative SQT1 Suppresses dominant-negative mutants of the ribosomal QSR1 protein [Rutstroemia sp. NJR-2017a WRK4]